MVLTEEQLAKMILPIIETVRQDKRPDAASEAVNSLVELVIQDRQAVLNDYVQRRQDNIREGLA